MNDAPNRDKRNHRGFLGRIAPRNDSRKGKVRPASSRDQVLAGNNDMEDSIHNSSLASNVSADVHPSDQLMDDADDPVEMLNRLRTSRLSKIKRGTTKVVKSASRNMQKTRQKVTRGTQARSSAASVSGRSKPLTTDIETTAEYDEEAAVVMTESDPLIGNENKSKVASKTPRSGAALWAKLRENKDELVFGQSVEDEEHTKESVELRKTRHKKKIENAFHRGLEFSLTQCLMAILAYLGIAVLAYSFVFEQWTIIDSMYFAVVSFTTIGYGDIVPSSHASRMFTAFFALSGVACLGIALGVLGSNLVDAQTKAIEQASELSQHHVMSLFDSSSQKQNEVDTIKTTAASSPKSPWLRSTFVKQVLPLFTLLFLCCWRLGHDAGWDAGSTLYYCIITATTVGYGDLSPQTQLGRLFAVPVILLAVGAMGHWLSILADAIFKHRQAAFRQQLRTHELTIADLEVMDADEDGKVTLAEYLAFMLVSMKKVDQELIEALMAQFDRLDVDGTGCLERNDLIIVAKRRLHSSKRKLELAQYKQRLLCVSNGNMQEEKSSRFISAVTSQLHSR